MREMRRRARMTREEAEGMAAKALLFLAEEPARLARFLAETGIEPSALRQRTADAEVLAAVLGHVLADESALLAFAANAGSRPEEVIEAERLLGGGSHWDST